MLLQAAAVQPDLRFGIHTGCTGGARCHKRGPDRAGSLTLRIPNTMSYGRCETVTDVVAPRQAHCQQNACARSQHSRPMQRASGSFACGAQWYSSAQATPIVLKQPGARHAHPVQLWLAVPLTVRPGGPGIALTRILACAAVAFRIHTAARGTRAAVAAAAACCHCPVLSLPPELRSAAAAMRRLKAVFFGETHCRLQLGATYRMNACWHAAASIGRSCGFLQALPPPLLPSLTQT